jgi:hypothetical protein
MCFGQKISIKDKGWYPFAMYKTKSPKNASCVEFDLMLGL